MLFILLTTIGMVIGCSSQQSSGGGGDASTIGSETTEQRGATTAPEGTPTASGGETTTASSPTSGNYAVGQTAQLQDQTLVVNQVQRNYSPPDQLPAPQAGNEYVLVNITVNNTGNGSIDFNPFDLQVQDSNGVQKGPEPFSEIANALVTPTTLGPRGRLTGNLLFESPQGDPGLELVYQPNPILRADETVTVTLPSG